MVVLREAVLAYSLPRLYQPLHRLSPFCLIGSGSLGFSRRWNSPFSSFLWSGDEMIPPAVGDTLCSVE